MDPTVALPLVMPGRFGVVCRISPYSEGPFNEGTYCVTLIPTKEILQEWAELIVEDWNNNIRYCGYSPYRSVVVWYFDANVYGFHRAGEEGLYDLTACRQLLTMADLFRDFTDAELVSISLYWRVHNGGPLVLDGRLPTLADHKAIQKWVLQEFQWQLHFACVKFNWPYRASRQMVQLHCNEELAAQNREREENLHREGYTIEGYEHFRFSMVLMGKLPQMERDALDSICSFLLGRPIANLHLVG